jgi:hypothetical protein
MLLNIMLKILLKKVKQEEEQKMGKRKGETVRKEKGLLKFKKKRG